jgi:hypothetical protein
MLHVLRKRTLGAWMDTFPADASTNPELQAEQQAETAQLQADGLAMQQQAVMASVQPVPIVLFTPEEGLESWNNTRRRTRKA